MESKGCYITVNGNTAFSYNEGASYIESARSAARFAFEKYLQSEDFSNMVNRSLLSSCTVEIEHACNLVMPD